MSDESFFTDENIEIENHIKMVEKKKNKKAVKKIIDDNIEVKLIAKVDTKISTPAGPLVIRQGEDCSIFSASVINRLKRNGVI